MGQARAQRALAEHATPLLAGDASVAAHDKKLVANPHAALATNGFFSKTLKEYNGWEQTKACSDRVKGGEPAHTRALCHPPALPPLADCSLSLRIVRSAPVARVCIGQT